MSPHECLSTSRPTCPDLWMITGKSTKMKRLGGAEVSVPSMSLLLPLMRQRNSKYFHRHTDQDGRIYFVMATYRPKPVPPGLLQRFVPHSEHQECREAVRRFGGRRCCHDGRQRSGPTPLPCGPIPCNFLRTGVCSGCNQGSRGHHAVAGFMLGRATAATLTEFLSLQSWVGAPAPMPQDVIGGASDEEVAPATPAKKRATPMRQKNPLPGHRCHKSFFGVLSWWKVGFDWGGETVLHRLTEGMSRALRRLSELWFAHGTRSLWYHNKRRLVGLRGIPSIHF